MRMLYLAFTPRFVCYTLSILFTAALLLIVLAAPSSIYVAGSRTDHPWHLPAGARFHRKPYDADSVRPRPAAR
jgi:hypothetical protein